MSIAINSRTTISVVVPVLAFGVVLALGMRGQPVSNDARSDSPFTTPISPPKQELVRTRETLPPAPAAQIAPPAPTAPVAPAAPIAPASPAGADMPLRLLIRPPHGPSAPLVTLTNLSDDAMEATVTDISATTHLRSQVQVEVLSHERKNITAAGLQVSPGDQVAVESPPYHSEIAQVPP